MVAISAPEDFGGWRKLESLPENLFLAVSAYHGEHFTDVEVDILVHAREIAGLAGVGVGAVKQDNRNLP